MDASGIDRFIGLAKKLGIQPARDVARSGGAAEAQNASRHTAASAPERSEGVRVSLSSAAVGAAIDQTPEAPATSSANTLAFEGAQLESARESVLRTGRHALAAAAYARSSAADPGQRFDTKA